MTNSKKSILIMDDEPHVLEWLTEYLEAKGYNVRLVTSIDEAKCELDKAIFRVAIFDLNIPVSDVLQEAIDKEANVYNKYKGLYAAKYARTKGHRDRQVIVYSVHDSEDVRAECGKIGIQYLIKARPREFKRELDNILSYDPTEKYN